LKWYSVASGGAALGSAPTPSTSSAGTTNYYVSQTTNGCESTRAMIAVTVNALPSAPTVISPVTYCQNATANALTASGTALEWYTVATGGTALASTPTPTTDNTGTTNYYVSQTTNGCESTRAMIAVTVNALPSAPSVISPVSYCQSATSTALTATGTTLQWYTSSTGGTGSVTAPIPSTSTAGTTNYYVSQTSNGCESGRAVIAVIINSAAMATITAGGSTTFCEGGSVTLTANSGSSYIWMNGTTQVGTNATYTANASGNYTVQITNPSGCTGQVTSSVTVVTVNAIPPAPGVNQAVAYCQNEIAAQLTATGTLLKWYSVATGGTASTAAPTPSTATAGTTNYYVSQAINSCEGPRAMIVVTVNALPTLPTVTSPVIYCQNTTAAQLTAIGASLKWYDTASGGTASLIAPAPSTSITGTSNYFVSQTTNGCEGARAMIAVTVNTIPEATITPSGPTTIVQGGSVVLQGNTGSALSYRWYKGNSLVGTGASYTATEAGSYTLEVTNGSGCTATSQATNVNINANQPSIIAITSPTPNTTIVGSITITANISDPDGGIALVEFLDGTTVIGTSTTAPYSFTWDNPGTGDHSITVRVTDSNGGVTTSSPTTVTSGTASGISSSVGTMYGIIYPNPSNGEVYIDSNIDLSNASVTLVDVLGKEAAHSSIATGSGAKVDVSGLSEGTYILIIKQDNLILRKKITVKR
jgi:hypothetical protein